MMEIYNEKVRDLLGANSKEASSLPVRQSAGEGFFVQGLKKVPVGSYEEIEKRMEQGIILFNTIISILSTIFI